MSYIVRIPLLQMNDNIFLHFLQGSYLVVFKNNSLCWEDNKLHNRNNLSNSTCSPFTENWLFSIPLQTVYIVIFVPDNWLYGSNSTEN